MKPQYLGTVRTSVYQRNTTRVPTRAVTSTFRTIFFLSICMHAQWKSHDLANRRTQHQGSRMKGKQSQKRDRQRIYDFGKYEHFVTYLISPHIKVPWGFPSRVDSDIDFIYLHQYSYYFKIYHLDTSLDGGRSFSNKFWL